MTNDFAEVRLARFRWLVPLALAPLALVASFQADVTKSHLGFSFRDNWELLCLALALLGFLIRLQRRYGDVFSMRFPYFGRLVYVAEPSLVTGRAR